MNKYKVTYSEFINNITVKDIQKNNYWHSTNDECRICHVTINSCNIKEDDSFIEFYDNDNTLLKINKKCLISYELIL